MWYKTWMVLIGHIQYINILTWFWGFQNKLLYLVVFSFHPSLLEIERQKKLKKTHNFYLKALDPCLNILQLLNEAEKDMKNSADQGGCYPQWPKAEVDNTLQDLQNSSHPTKAEFNDCSIIHSKYFLLLKGVSPLCSLFFRSPNITQPCPQVLSVNSSIICSRLHFGRHFDLIGSVIFGGLHFWRRWFNVAKTLSKLGEQQMVMVNYACGFNQSETGKYFEWIIMCNSRKYPYLPHGRDFFCNTPRPLLWNFQISFIHFFKFFALQNPPTPQEIPIPSVGEVWIFSGTAQW